MDEALDFQLKLPSLMELVQIKIAYSLWSSELGTNSFKIPSYNSIIEVKSRISALPIPRRQQEDLETYVNYVGVQISLLRQHFSAWFECFPNDALRWTAYGIIDFDHMARVFVQDDRIPIVNRYEMCCNFCWEEDIERLWNEMKPGDFQRQRESVLVQYWSYIAKRKPISFKIFRRLSNIMNLFYTLTSGLTNLDFFKVPQLKYFWGKMTEVEKMHQIARLKRKVQTESNPSDHCEGWCYFLSQMDRDDQVDILKSSPAFFLKLFLNRPWQHLFFPVLRLVERCQTFKNALPRFLGEISLDQCDNSMRQRFFDHLRPLFPEYVYNNRQLASWCLFKLREGEHEYVLEIMRDATEAQKMALLMYTIQHPDDVYESQAPYINVLIEAWVTRDSWPDLKVKLKHIFGQSDVSFPYIWLTSDMRLQWLKDVKKLIDSLDEHFAS